MFRLPRFTFANLFEFVLQNSAWNCLHVIYLYILKTCFIRVKIGMTEFVELDSGPWTLDSETLTLTLDAERWTVGVKT